MRNKIKQLMNKEEGFTLVELLAVIVILGIIVAIAIPSIGNIVEDSRESANEAEIELIEDAARLYDVDNEVGTSGVTTSTLQTEGFLDLRDSEISGTVTYESGQYVFEAD